jgi:hypothetical protein
MPTLIKNIENVRLLLKGIREIVPFVIHYVLS